MESGRSHVLRRVGVTADIVDPGDYVRISGYPSRVDGREMLGAAIELPDGRTVPMFPTLAARFGVQCSRVLTSRAMRRSKANAPPTASSRVWTYGRVSDRPVAEAAYTTQAIARQRDYDPLVDDPALRCEPQGMPLIMDNPFPIQFTDQGDRIILELEIWDIVRTIHMTDAESAEAHRGTPLGYSMGYWDGGQVGCIYVRYRRALHRRCRKRPKATGSKWSNGSH